jgi:non-specific serine/threonine protein kinase
VAAVVQMLLQRCPGLRVLATSRQRLGLPGEVAWRVPSLPAPEPKQLPLEADEAVTVALGFAAVRLFVDRAAAVRPGFRLTSGAEAAAVGQICRRLDGIPLAIELAAARARVLTPGQIAARLDDRFRLLTGGARGALPRHQTLRALIDWSYDQLSAAEAALLRRLSVFAGGWTLEAAEAVCGDRGLQIADRRLQIGEDPSDTPQSAICKEEVLDLLDSLVDRSLVLVDEVAEGLRYRMLETVRAYAGEKLTASGEVTAVRNRHRDWCLQLAEQRDVAVHGRQYSAWLARLEVELDNLRAALAWCQEQADSQPGSDAAAAGLRLADALFPFWTNRGYLAEGWQWLEGALARGGQLPAALRVPALIRAEHLAYSRGDRDRSVTFRQAARLDSQEALALARREGDRAAVARALLSLAEATAKDGDLDAAWSFCLEARPLFEDLGEVVGLAGTLEWLASIASRRGDRQAARALLEERLATCRAVGESELLIHALGGMGHLERDEGDYTRARALYHESLLLRRKLGHQLALAQSLEDLAALAGRERQWERAVRLLGAAEAFCETLGVRPPVAVIPEYERTVAEGGAALGEAAFAAAWAEGRALSLDQAIEYELRHP